MKLLYYRSEKVSKAALVCMALFALSLALFLELEPLRARAGNHDKMVRASFLAGRAYKAIRDHREQLGHRMLKAHDPLGTGMLGPSMSLVTTLPGHLDAKQASVNPNFAAVVVKYLLDLGAKPGDRVGIGCTGSFPALNIAVLAAAETLDLEVAMISSAASSQYGANHPEFMWPDMERLLEREGILNSRSLAISRGGFRDDACGMTQETRSRLDDAIARSEIPFLEPQSGGNPVDTRMRCYLEGARRSDFLAYINVGGGFMSVGGTKGNDLLGSGLILPPISAETDNVIDSVAHRFLEAGVPVINMINVLQLGRRHGLTVATVEPIQVGSGQVFQSLRYRRAFALLAFVLVFGQVYFVMRPPTWWMHRARLWPGKSEGEPQLMV
jgi:poly-gamma-glutamate system protein